MAIILRPWGFPHQHPSPFIGQPIITHYITQDNELRFMRPPSCRESWPWRADRERSLPSTQQVVVLIALVPVVA